MPAFGGVMEIVGIIVVVVVVLALIGRSKEKRLANTAGSQRPVPGPPPDPVVTPGERIRLCAGGRVSVRGESHYQSALHEAVKGVASGRDLDGALQVRAELIPEPSNRYDRKAVRVDVDGRCVGYLPRELAVDYQPVLLWLQSRGQVGWCPGRVMGGDERWYGIYLHLGPSDCLVPANVPGDLEVLDADRSVTVVGEERHQEALGGFVASPVAVFASLSSAPIERGKYAGEDGIEVRINGERVGELTKTMSDRYSGLIRAVVASGRAPGCEAVVSDTPKGRQVELRLPKV